MRRKNAYTTTNWVFSLWNRYPWDNSNSVDRVILGTTMALALSGLVMVFSSSGILAESRFSESTYFLQRQAIWLTLGAFSLWFAARIDYTIWELHALTILMGTVCLLILVLMLGHQVNGARRWLQFSWFSVQPAELTKLAVVMYLARYLSQPDLRMTEWKQGVFRPLLIVSLPAGLILLEPDLGNVVVLGLLLVGMLYLSGSRGSHLAGLCVPLVAIMMGLIRWSPERWERMATFWDPWKDPKGAGYQLVQSFLAFGNGGVSGVGLGQGKQKLLYLPEGHTDFVLALVGEEFGLIGTTTLMTLFAFMVYKGFQIAAQTKDLFGRNLALGITLLFGIQVLINAAVVSGLLPTKGLTLPLVSYGGSSLLTSLFAIGILLSISRRLER